MASAFISPYPTPTKIIGRSQEFFGKYELISSTKIFYFVALNPICMKLKTAILISSGILLAGTAYWFFAIRGKDGISIQDRDDMKQAALNF